MMKEAIDQQQIYCPKLGHHLTFEYCKGENAGYACQKVLKCWSLINSMRDIVTEKIARNELKLAPTPPQPKITSIITLIEKAKKRMNT